MKFDMGQPHEVVIDFDPDLSEMLLQLHRLDKLMMMIEERRGRFEHLFDCCESDIESEALKDSLIENTRNHIVFLSAEIRQQWLNRRTEDE